MRVLYGRLQLLTVTERFFQLKVVIGKVKFTCTSVPVSLCETFFGKSASVILLLCQNTLQKRSFKEVGGTAMNEFDFVALQL